MSALLPRLLPSCAGLWVMPSNNTKNKRTKKKTSQVPRWPLTATHPLKTPPAVNPPPSPTPFQCGRPFSAERLLTLSELGTQLRALWGLWTRLAKKQGFFFPYIKLVIANWKHAWCALPRLCASCNYSEGANVHASSCIERGANWWQKGWRLWLPASAPGSHVWDH